MVRIDGADSNTISHGGTQGEANAPMKARRISLLALSVVVSVAILVIRYGPDVIRSQTVDVAPDRVVGRFYDWYLSYFGDASSGKLLRRCLLW
jgi:hypothetical protein